MRQPGTSPATPSATCAVEFGMNSRVHPAYKTRYHVTNWADYDRGPCSLNSPRERDLSKQLELGTNALKRVRRVR